MTLEHQLREDERFENEIKEHQAALLLAIQNFYDWYKTFGERKEIVYEATASALLHAVVDLQTTVSNLDRFFVLSVLMDEVLVSGTDKLQNGYQNIDKPD